MSGIQAQNSGIAAGLPRLQPMIVRAFARYAGLCLAALDLLAILLIPAVLVWLFGQPAGPRKAIDFWVLVAGVGVMLINSHGGYRLSGRETSVKRAGLAIFCYWVTAGAMLTVAMMLGHPHAVSLSGTSAELGLTPALLLLNRRLAMPRLQQAARPGQEAGPLVICYDRWPENLERAIALQVGDASISGVLFLLGATDERGAIPWPVVPNVLALLEILRTRRVQDIIFIYRPELEATSTTARRELLSELVTQTIRIWFAVDLGQQLPEPLLRRASGFELFPLGPEDLVDSTNPGKRLFDLALGGLLLVSVLLVIGITSVAILLCDGRPVLFRQTRVGAQGRPFEVLKFRTMEHRPGARFEQARRGDARVTRTGRLLRRSSLDELPQLLNVIRGEMSLVGPRPHAAETAVAGVTFENAVKYYRLRHRVKPGITGLAQIRGQRGETREVEALAQRIASDIEYIETWSIWLDVWIILRTIPLMFSQQNAY